ncbi:MAG: porin family protein [Crocinitomicaceae bacterium]
MSKEFKNIDDLFKSTIGLGNESAPSHIKTNVLSKIGGGNWWIAGASVLLVTSVVGIFTVFNTDNFEPAYETRLVLENLQIDEYVTPSFNIQQSAFTKSNSIPQSKKTNISFTNKENTITDKSLNAVKKKSKLRKSKNFQPTEPVKQEKSETIKNSTLMISKQKESAVKNSDDLLTIADEAIVAYSNKKTDISLVEGEIKPEKIENQPNRSESNITEVQTKNKSILKKEQILSEAVKPSLIENEITSNNIDDSIEVVSSVRTDSSQIIQAASSDADIEILSDPSPKKGQLSIGVLGGPNINSAIYKNSELAVTLNKLHNEKLGYFGQVYAQYVTYNNFSVLLGVGIEGQTYNTTFLTTDTIFVNEVVTTELKNHYGVTSAQFLQLPVRLGYQMEKNKWQFGIDLGVQLNYLLKSSGKYLSHNKVLPIENANVFKSITNSYSIGGSLEYNLFKQFYISGQARFTPPLVNYYQENYAKRYVNSLSFGMGMSVKF